MLKQTDEIKERRGGDAVVEDLQEHPTQSCVRVDQGRCRSCSDREKTEQAVTEMIDREIRDHPFQVALRPSRQRRKDDRAHHQRKEPRAGDFDFVWKKRNEQSDKTVNAHFRKPAGQHHRHAGRRRLISVRQPGVKWKKRDFDGEAEENSGEGEPFKIAGEQSAFAEISQRREIERSFGKINSEKREQHGHAAEECVNEKLYCSEVAIFATVNFDEQKRRNQAHLIKQKPENKILGGEGAVERGLHHEHERARAAFQPLGAESERKNERCQQNEKQAQTIDADEIFGTDRRNPGVALRDLQTRRSGIEFLPKQQGIKRRERVEDERDRARVFWLADVKRDRAGERNKNERTD